MSHRTALLSGVLAAALSGTGMLLLRWTLQVRTLPERLLEWLLLFVPPEQFEAVLQRFGFDAKLYALDIAILCMLGLLSVLGYVELSRRWPSWAIAATGVVLWLFVMLIVMPLTAAGVFAYELLEGRRATIGAYLAIGLTYSAALGGARMLVPGGSFTPSTPLGGQSITPRRTAIGLFWAAGLAYAGTYLAVLVLPRRPTPAAVLSLEDPQEPVPSGGLDPPNPHPNVVGSPRSEVAASPEPQPTLGSVVADLPEPSSARGLKRDKDGAVQPSGRTPGQLADALTSNPDFYVVTKNPAGDPFVRPADWRLLVDGEVGHSVQLDYAMLRKLPAVEVTKTLECISNFVGKPELAPFGAELIGTASWKGVRVRDVLQLAGGPKPSATWVAVLAADEYTSALPLEAMLDPSSLLVYEMNGEVLPREHGYPLRLLIPNRYGMKNPKWVLGVRLLPREFTDWYGQRHWSKTAIVRTMTRIDSPAPDTLLPPGERTLSGVAYAGQRGISKVEVSVDGSGSWLEAELLDPPTASQDRWVRWQAPVTLAPGARRVVVARATDGAGELQIEPFALPEPDGGSGWPSLEIHASYSTSTM